MLEIFTHFHGPSRIHTWCKFCIFHSSHSRTHVSQLRTSVGVECDTPLLSAERSYSRIVRTCAPPLKSQATPFLILDVYRFQGPYVPCLYVCTRVVQP